MHQKSEILANLNSLNKIISALKTSSLNVEVDAMQTELQNVCNKGSSSSEAMAAELYDIFMDTLDKSNQLCSKIIALAIKEQDVKITKQITVDTHSPLKALASQVENFQNSISKRNQRYVKTLTAHKTKLVELYNKLKVNPEDPKVKTLDLNIQKITDCIEEINGNLTALTVSKKRYRTLKKSNAGVTIEAAAPPKSNIYESMSEAAILRDLVRQSTVRQRDQAKFCEEASTGYAARAKTESEKALNYAKQALVEAVAGHVMQAEVNAKTAVLHAKQAKAEAEIAKVHATNAKAAAEIATENAKQAEDHVKIAEKNEIGVARYAKQVALSAEEAGKSAKNAKAQAKAAAENAIQAENKAEAAARLVKEANILAEPVVLPEPVPVEPEPIVDKALLVAKPVITNSNSDEEKKPVATKQSKKELKLIELKRNIDKAYEEFKLHAKISQELSFTPIEQSELCLDDPIIQRNYSKFQRVSQKANQLISDTEALMNSQASYDCYSTLLSNSAALFTLNENGKRNLWKSAIIERQNSLNPFPGSPAREAIDAKIDAAIKIPANKVNPLYRRKIELDMEKNLFLSSLRNFLECVSKIHLVNGKDKNTQNFADALIKNLQIISAALQADNIPFNIKNVDNFYQGLINTTRQQLIKKNLDLILTNPDEIQQFLTDLNKVRESGFFRELFNTDSEETTLKNQIIALRSFNQKLVVCTQQTEHSYSIIKAFQDVRDPTFILNKREKLQKDLVGMEQKLKAKLHLLPQDHLSSNIIPEVVDSKHLIDYIQKIVPQLNKEYEEYVNVMQHLDNQSPGLNASPAETEKHARLIESVQNKAIERLNTCETEISKRHDLLMKRLVIYYNQQKKNWTDQLQKTIQDAEITLSLTCTEENEVTDRLRVANEELEKLNKDQSTLTIENIEEKVKALKGNLLNQINQVRIIEQKKGSTQLNNLKRIMKQAPSSKVVLVDQQLALQVSELSKSNPFKSEEILINQQLDLLLLELSKTNPFRAEVVQHGLQLNTAIKAAEDAYRYYLTGAQITPKGRKKFNKILDTATKAKNDYNIALNIAKEIDKRMQSKEYKTSLSIINTLDSEFLRIFDKKSQKKLVQEQNNPVKLVNLPKEKIDLNIQSKTKHELVQPKNNSVKLVNFSLKKINPKVEAEDSSYDSDSSSSYESDSSSSYESDSSSSYESDSSSSYESDSSSSYESDSSEYTSEDESDESSYDDSSREKDSDIVFNSEPSSEEFSESDSQAVELKNLSVNKGRLFLAKDALTPEDANSLNVLDPRLVKLWKIRNDFIEANNDYLHKNLNFKERTLKRMTNKFVALVESQWNIPESELTDNETLARLYLVPSLFITEQNSEVHDSYKAILNRIDPALVELGLKIRVFDETYKSDKSSECYVDLLFNKIKTHLHNDQIEHISDGQNSAFTQFIREYVFKPWRELKQWVNSLFSNGKHYFFTTFGATKTEAALVEAGNEAAASLEEIQAARAVQNAEQEGLKFW